MKKIILMLVSSLAITTTMANYMVTIGQGIPKESIKFVSNTPSEPVTPTEPEKKPECAAYNYSNNYTFYQNYGATENSDPYYGSILYWNGLRIIGTNGGKLQPKVFSFDSNGYRYTADTKLMSTQTYSNVAYKGFYYGICRVPL